MKNMRMSQKKQQQTKYFHITIITVTLKWIGEGESRSLISLFHKWVTWKWFFFFFSIRNYFFQFTFWKSFSRFNPKFTFRIHSFHLCFGLTRYLFHLFFVFFFLLISKTVPYSKSAFAMNVFGSSNKHRCWWYFSSDFAVIHLNVGLSVWGKAVSNIKWFLPNAGLSFFFFFFCGMQTTILCVNFLK